MNISSVLLMVKPENVEGVITAVEKVKTAEYHMHDELGKIIITIEGENLDEELKLLKQIKAIPKVISAEMMYSYSEDELDDLRKGLEKNNDIPGWLNDENVKAEDIKYHGDLKKKII